MSTIRSEKMQQIHEFRFSQKHMRPLEKDNPKKVIPSRFIFYYGEERISLSYHSLIMEGPKSLVCRYVNKNSDKNGLPSRLIVKYQLKFQAYPWSHRLKSSITKRYLDTDKGDVLCTTLADSERLCSYYGTYVLVANPRQEAPDRWETYIRTPNVPQLGDDRSEEAFVIQIFQEIRGCDLYSYLCEDGSAEICTPGSRDNIYCCLQIIADIFEGLNIMHRSRIYHGDLKPENIMLYHVNRDGHKEVNGSHLRATIIDFDFAARIEHERIKRGTPRYLSPEYLQAYRGHIDLPSLGEWGREFDIWAIGAIMWTMFFGGRRGEKLYFTSYSTDQLKNSAMTSKVIQAMMVEKEYEKYLAKRVGKPGQGGYKDHLRTLIIELLAYDPKDRPTAGQAFRRIQEIQHMIRVAASPAHKSSISHSVLGRKETEA